MSRTSPTFCLVEIHKVLQREGEGWRLAWDAQREPFPVLIGGQDWASELTAAEGLALQSALQTLRGQHRDLAETLMAEETISLDFHGSAAAPSNVSKGGAEGHLWVSLEGDRQTWTLRFVLQPAPGQRGLEGFWGTGAAAAFLEAYIELLW
jgi:hypothetical protein